MRRHVRSDPDIIGNYVDTLEKAHILLNARQYPTAVERLEYIFYYLPEVKTFSLSDIAILSGLQDSTVRHIWKHFK